MNGDYEAIMNLINSYPEYLDEGDHEGLGRLFERGSLVVTYDGPGGNAPPYVGYEAVKEFFYENVVKQHKGKPRTRHFVANVVLKIDDDGQAARARSYYVRIDPGSPSQPLQIIITGRYRDRFAKINGSWWIVERQIMSDYSASALSK